MTSCNTATIPYHFCSGLRRSIHSAGTTLSYFDVLCMISHPPSGHKSWAPLPSWVNTEVIKSITTVYTTFNVGSLFWKGSRLNGFLSIWKIFRVPNPFPKLKAYRIIKKVWPKFLAKSQLYAKDQGSCEGKHFLLSKCLQTFILLKTQDRFHLSPCTSCTHRYYTAWTMSR